MTLRSLAAEGAIDAAEYDGCRRRIIGGSEESLSPAGTTITYKGGLFLFAGVAFLGVAGIFVWVMSGGVPGPRHLWILLGPLAALSLALGILFSWLFIGSKSEGRRALVLDNRGIEYRPVTGRPFQIPWDQVIRVREKVESTGEGGERFVVLDLRAPLSTFRVPPREKDRRGSVRAREGKLALQTQLLDIPKDDLIRLIRRHLSEADVTPGATAGASSRP